MVATALSIRESAGVPAVQTIAQHFVKSGFFKDTRDVSQAVVRIMAGSELGFGPFASMQGVHIIEGKTAIAASLMAAAIQKSGRYDYRVREHTDTACAIEFLQGKESLGLSTFTMEDARTANLAGKGPWKQYPRNMLWARAMSNGARWYCAGIFAGAVYTPEELGADVDEDGSVVQSAQPAPIRMVDAVTAEVSLPAEQGVAQPFTPASVDEQAARDLRGWESKLAEVGAKPRAEVTDKDRAWMKMLAPTLDRLAAELGVELPSRSAVKDWYTGIDWAGSAIDALLNRPAIES